MKPKKKNSSFCFFIQQKCMVIFPASKAWCKKSIYCTAQLFDQPVVCWKHHCLLWRHDVWPPHTSEHTRSCWGRERSLDKDKGKTFFYCDDARLMWMVAIYHIAWTFLSSHCHLLTYIMIIVPNQWRHPVMRYTIPFALWCVCLISHASKLLLPGNPCQLLIGRVPLAHGRVRCSRKQSVIQDVPLLTAPESFRCNLLQIDQLVTSVNTICRTHRESKHVR